MPAAIVYAVAGTFSLGNDLATALLITVELAPESTKAHTVIVSLPVPTCSLRNNSGTFDFLVVGLLLW